MRRCCRILALIISSCLLLTACYHVPVQQGNIITSRSASKIRRGMNRSQVLRKLGPPVLTNLFNPNVMVYVYTLRPSHGPLEERKLLIYLKNQHVVRVRTHGSHDMNLPTPAT